MIARTCQSARSLKDAYKNRRDYGRNLTRTAPPVASASWAGNGTGSGRARAWNGDIEGGQSRCSRCSQFCSQSVPSFRRMLSMGSLHSRFQRQRAIKPVFYIPFLARGNTGNSENLIEAEGLASWSWWNNRRTAGNSISRLPIVGRDWNSAALAYPGCDRHNRGARPTPGRGASESASRNG
jgi:hypothetical protein